MSAVEGADRIDRLSDLHAALWPVTLGYYGEQLLAPLFTDALIDDLQAHFVSTFAVEVHYLGRIGDQPYGLRCDCPRAAAATASDFAAGVPASSNACVVS